MNLLLPILSLIWALLTSVSLQAQNAVNQKRKDIDQRVSQISDELKQLSCAKHYVVVINADERLLNHTNQATTDIDWIMGFVENFYNYAYEQEGILRAQSTFQMAVTPQVGQPNVIDLEQALSINLSSYPSHIKKAALARWVRNLRPTLATLYRRILTDKTNKAQFEGSEQYRLLLERETLLLRPNTMLLWITDGHFNHQSTRHPVLHNGHKTTASDEFVPTLIKADLGWSNLAQANGYGILPLPVRFPVSNHVIIAGITPKTQSYVELPILRWMWRDWLKQMGINHVTFLADTDSESYRIVKAL